MPPSAPPPAPRATPLLRRLPANATPDQIMRAYADALLYVLQTQPAQLEEQRKIIDDAKATVLVADAVSQRAANTASSLELRVHEVGQVQQELVREQHRLGLLVDRAQIAMNRLEGIEQDMRSKAKSIPDLAKAVERLAEDVEEITDHGQNRPPQHDSERVRGAVKEVLEDAELEAWRGRRKWVGEVAKSGAGALAGAGLLEVARLLFLGHW